MAFESSQRKINVFIDGQIVSSRPLYDSICTFYSNTGTGPQGIYDEHIMLPHLVKSFISSLVYYVLLLLPCVTMNKENNRKTVYTCWCLLVRPSVTGQYCVKTA